MKILLVEDSEEAASLFGKFMLGGMDAEIIYAKNMNDALRLDRDEKPDVTILDLNLMPDSPTAKTMARIRDFKSPVIVLTAMPDDALESRSMDAGAVGYFQKIDALNNPAKFREAIVNATK